MLYKFQTKREGNNWSDWDDGYRSPVETREEARAQMNEWATQAGDKQVTRPDDDTVVIVGFGELPIHGAVVAFEPKPSAEFVSYYELDADSRATAQARITHLLGLNWYPISVTSVSVMDGDNRFTDALITTLMVRRGGSEY